jgi:uncharacterized membrane protein YebE (DUF533 family)
MANFGDLIGAMLQNTMAPSGQQRMGNALEDLMRSGISSLGGGAQGGEAAAPSGAGAGAGGGLGGLLGQVLGAVQGGLSSAAQSPGQAGGIGAVLGGLLGGGGDSVKGALGGGALAMLASIAFKAMQGAGQAPAQATAGGATMPGFNMPGLMPPQTQAQEQAAEATAQVILKAMISAAKADGQIDSAEMQRIVGKLQEVGMDEQIKAWVMNEMSQPLNLDGLVAAIPSQEVAAQVYAASLLAIEVDTDAERAYLAQLAQKTQLHPMVVQHIQQSMGISV